MTETTVDLKESREAATERLANAKQAAACAVLDGGKPNIAAVQAAEAELSAFDAAENEQGRREREAQDARWREASARYRSDLSTALGARLKAVDRAEKAARALVDALADERDASKTITTALQRLGMTAPLSLMRPEVERRISARLIASLRGVSNQMRRYGALNFGLSREVRASDSWGEAEAKEVNEVIDSILKGKRNG